MDYNYLVKFIGHNDLKGNYFIPVTELEIKKSEEKMNARFPAQLRQFYTQIGAGILSCGCQYPQMFSSSLSNEILPPHIAVDYMLGIIEHPEEEQYYMAESTYEILQPGDLPFFEIGDSSSFMIMKLHSENPNAVWYMGAEKIEDSFERFIHNLYYKGPSYYVESW